MLLGIESSFLSMIDSVSRGMRTVSRRIEPTSGPHSRVDRIPKTIVSPALRISPSTDAVAPFVPGRPSMAERAGIVTRAMLPRAGV